MAITPPVIPSRAVVRGAPSPMSFVTFIIIGIKIASVPPRTTIIVKNWGWLLLNDFMISNLLLYALWAMFLMYKIVKIDRDSLIMLIQKESNCGKTRKWTRVIMQISTGSIHSFRVCGFIIDDKTSSGLSDVFKAVSSAWGSLRSWVLFSVMRFSYLLWEDMVVTRIRQAGVLKPQVKVRELRVGQAEMPP